MGTVVMILMMIIFPETILVKDVFDISPKKKAIGIDFWNTRLLLPTALIVADPLIDSFNLSLKPPSVCFQSWTEQFESYMQDGE